MKKVFKDLKELKSAIGQKLESPHWFEVTQELVNEFAHATKDFQWIHTDPERAKTQSPFGCPIAHGFYSLSLVPKFMEDTFVIKSAKMGVNYGLNKVRFINPVPVGSRLKAIIEIAQIEDYHGGIKALWNISVLIENSEKPACVAEMISLLFE